MIIVPVVDPDNDYEVVHEDSHDDGFETATVTAVDDGKPVEVHIYAKRDDRDEFNRVRGFTLCGPPSYDNLETTVGIPIDVDGNQIHVYTEICVKANGPIEDVTTEVRQ